MKKILIIALFALFTAASCADTPPQSAQRQNGQTNVNVAIKRTDDTLTVSSHSQNRSESVTIPENANAPGANSTAGAKPQNGSPMSRAVDVSKMTEDIEKAKAVYEKNAKNEEAKKALAKAYFERAFALTNAAQYRAALGDYRKGLKLDPADEPAKKMYDEILRIFESIGREPPKEGEEPPPMPIK